MSDPRYVIARDGFPDLGDVVCSLPDAEHIHVTRHPDGTITAVPMQRAIEGDEDVVRVEVFSGALSLNEDVPLWVDCPTGGDAEETP